MQLRSYIGFTIAFLVGCVERAPVSEKDANVYQKAVYYNSDRPIADRRRDKERRPADILEFSGIKSGDKVVDLLGAGGWYTELLSKVVGNQGKVYLVNTPLFLNFSEKDIEERLKEQHLKNVVRLDVAWDKLNLPEEVDFIWLTLSFHDIYVKRPPEKKHFEADRDHFFDQLRRSLKTGGYLLISDHAARPGSGLTDIKLHRIDEEYVRADVESEGFVFIRSLDVLRNPNDDYSKDIWNEAVKRKTDRFVHLYQRTQ